MKKPFELATLMEYGTLSDLTNNRPDMFKNHGHPGWGGGHDKYDLDTVSAAS